MASLDFPSSPTNGQTYSSAGVTWTYDSTYTVWNVTSSGPVGYSGSQGYTGSKGDIGYSGSLGYTGSAGTNGTNGYNGSQGYTGSASTVIGYTGSKGDIGYTGSAGTNGTNGYTGSAGTTGYTGSLGYSGSTASINWMYKTANYTAVNNDGILADTTSASFTVTLPASPATGTYVSIVDVTSTFATNPLTVAGNGETLQGLTYTSLVLNVTSAKVDLIYEGAYWAVATTSGTRGYTGSIGYTGSQGTDGYTGSQGYSGSVGYTGSQGYNGSQGYTGSAGYTGSQGYTGSKGDIGYTGSAGVGYTGSQGYTGSKGDIGYTGSQGYTGSKGDIGYTGSQGYTGSASTVIGYTGSKGDIGYTGSIPAALTATSLALGGATLGTNNLAVTGTTQLSSSLGIGMTPVNVLDITQTQDNASIIGFKNASTGTSGRVDLRLYNSSNLGILTLFGTGFTSANVLRSGGVLLQGDGSGGVTLNTGAAQPIYFGINSTERARIGSDGSFLVGTTTNAGAGVISSSSSITSNSGQMVMGCPTGSYGSLGYAAKPAGVNAWTYGVSDYAVWMQYGVNSGTLQVYTAGSGTAGNAITPTQGPYVSNLGTSWTSPSDARLKDQFTAVSGVLDKLANIIVGTYVWSGQGQTPTGRADLGIRAQEVYAQFPSTVDKPDTDDGMGDWQEGVSKKWGFNESKMGVIAIAGVKELHAIIQELTTRLAALEAK